MDEIGLMKKYKEIWKILNIYISVYATLLIIMGIVASIIHKNWDVITFGKIFMLIFGFGISINILFIVVFSVMNLVYKLTNKKMNIELSKEYIRELYNDYPPAIISLIYDLNTEVYRDYTATILYLYAKKYIDILGFNEEIRIDKGLNENLSKLLTHEKYVYNCIINKNKFDENEFCQCIIKDSKEQNLLTTGEVGRKEKKLVLIISIIAISLIYLFKIK